MFSPFICVLVKRKTRKVMVGFFVKFGNSIDNGPEKSLIEFWKVRVRVSTHLVIDGNDTADFNMVGVTSVVVLACEIRSTYIKQMFLHDLV